MGEESQNPSIAVSALLDGLLADNIDAATELWRSKLPIADSKASEIETDLTSIRSRDHRLRLKKWDNRAFLNILDFGSCGTSWHAIAKGAEQLFQSKPHIRNLPSLGIDVDSDGETVVENNTTNELHNPAHFDSSQRPQSRNGVIGPARTKSTDARINMADSQSASKVDLDIVRALLKRIEKLEADNVSLKDIIKQHDPDRPEETTLSNRWTEVHRVGERMFMDEPSWLPQEDGQLILKGHEPLLDKESYLERHPEIVFLVLLDYDSDDNSNPGSDHQNKVVNNSVAPITESIRMTTIPMKQAYDCLLEKTRMGEAKSFDSSYEVDAPYLFWYFAKPELDIVLSALSDEESKLIRLLGDYIEKSQGVLYSQVSEGLERGWVNSDRLGFLFRPGNLVVSSSNGLTQGHIIQDFAKYFTPPGDNVITVNVNTWTIAVDDDFRRKESRWAVSRFPEGQDPKEVKITCLPVYPLSFADDHLVSTLKKRAALFWRCRSHQLVQYIQDLHRNEPQRYIIDQKTFKKLHMSGSSIINDSSPEQRILDFDAETGPSGDHCYLFPPETIAYNLERKSWDIAVDNISEVQWDKKAFDNLVLSDSRTKELIHALITTKLAAEEGQGADLIKGKGNGLIMLLHGGPGTGKTFTAEAVAEIAEKPLYRVTCGDIGTKPQEVEKYLESVFYLARTWDSVILLDEADVFLEQRGLSDLDRNALVSVFLRVLEYFEGILVLTSNRVGTFDEAFKSRIQLALHYPNLNVPQRRKIWRTFLNRLRNISVGQIDYDDILDNLDELARRDINGRGIRNALTTARQLAQYRKQVMTFSDLEYVIDVASKFDDYIQTEIREGLTDDQLARERGDR
ncbi:hypothetical protein PG993_014779 [Apiospora rasikravindrae]|uniref:AAA+ ATPase domain-containing protein n=1 Tax=Apiospora rasikravindrae TaxID=990691 RepID=A0ABR1RNQ2_9PEZI